MQMNHSSRLQALLCSVCVGASAIVVHPVLEAGIMDDASYTRTAQVLAQTGHLTYNGWGAMPLGWQVYVAALFIKLFGFSFTVVRLSALPAALLTAFLIHRILCRCGISTRNATLTTLALVFSPLFVVMSVTFMTDVSSLFVTLLCLYALLGAVQAEGDTHCLAWLFFAIASNALGGTVRQTAWLGVLIMVPSTLWLLRDRTRVLRAGIPALAVAIAFLVYALHWFARQPYTIPESLLPPHLGTSELVSLFFTLTISLLTFPFLFLPVLLPFLWFIRRSDKRATWVVLGITLLAALAFTAAVAHRHRVVFGMVRMPGSLLQRGEERGLNNAGQIFGLSHSLLNTLIRLVLTVTSISVITAVLAAVFPRRNSAPALPVASSVSQPTPQTLTVLLLPFATAYFLLLLPRASEGFLFFRYLLPLAFVAAIGLVRFFQDRISPSLPRLTPVAIAALALYGVADTHDFFSMGRARLAAAAELRAAGVPETDIDSGTSSNLFHYMELHGYIDDPKIRIPADAYKPAPKRSAKGGCHAEWDYLMPLFQPVYVVTFVEDACGGPAGFAPVPYSTWLPPYSRKMYVLRYEAPPTPSAAPLRTDPQPAEDVR